jgi:hypothetical protein
LEIKPANPVAAADIWRANQEAPFEIALVANRRFRKDGNFIRVSQLHG